MASPTFYLDGHTPNKADTELRVSQKILGTLIDGGGGGGGGTVQVYSGRAPAAPDDVTKAAVDYPIGGGPLSQWNGSAWV